MDSSTATTIDASERVALRTWAICGLLLLATMLMYMDRQALSQQKTEILGALESDQRGLRPARARIRAGVRGRGDRHGVHRRPDQPALALPGGPAGLVDASGSRPAGSPATASCSSAGCCWGSSRPGTGPVRW